MKEYLSNSFKDVPKNHKVHAVTPAEKHLLEVKEMARKRSKDDSQIFHTILDKLLFLSKQAQLDIITGVALLTNRVIEQDEKNEKKLSRILKYLQSTRDLLLILD